MITIHEIDDEHTYETEISQSVGVTGYHHWFFLMAMAEALQLKFRAFAVDSNGERLGVVPLLFRRRGIVSTVNYLPINCVGPLPRGETLRTGRIPELVSAVEPVLRRELTALTMWGFAPGLNVRAGLRELRGFELTDSESYVIPATKSIDDCLKSMSRVRRQSIRQSEGHGAFVADSTTEEIKHWLPGQIMGAFQRQGTYGGYKLAEVRTLTERLATHPRMLWRTARSKDDEVLGITGCIVGEDRLWGWIMAGPPTPGISAHSLIYWNMIEWALPRGLSYDLGGVPTEGIRKFKISMGAELETCVSALRIRPRAYKAGRASYNWAMTRLVARKNEQG